MNPTQLKQLADLIQSGNSMLARIESLLPPATPAIDWKAHAYRWRKLRSTGYLQSVTTLHRIRLSDLHGIDEQKAAIQQNTRQFVSGRSANNVLLTGSRGTGKSSLIKAVLNKFAARGLRLIEVDKDDLIDLPEIVELLRTRKEYFVIFCDDLSFEANEPGYKHLKSVLDGSVSGMPDNLLVYATSNRRHLMPEFMQENLQAKHDDAGELHPAEATEEKVSLSERFGLWMSFYPFDQQHYLAICTHWLAELGMTSTQCDAARGDALRFALQRGSRSGRVAWQFARHYAGKFAGKFAGGLTTQRK